MARAKRTTSMFTTKLDVEIIKLLQRLKEERHIPINHLIEMSLKQTYAKELKNT